MSDSIQHKGIRRPPPATTSFETVPGYMTRQVKRYLKGGNKNRNNPEVKDSKEYQKEEQDNE